MSVILVLARDIVPTSHERDNLSPRFVFCSSDKVTRPLIPLTRFSRITRWEDSPAKPTAGAKAELSWDAEGAAPSGVKEQKSQRSTETRLLSLIRMPAVVSPV